MPGPEPKTIVVDELYQDEHIVVANKPAGVATHAGGKARGLVEQLQKQVGSPLGVHQRLDAVTSGVIAFSCSKRGRDALAKAFEQRLAHKTYLALLAGHPPRARGRMEDHLLQRSERHAVDPSGKIAVTDFEVLSTVGPYALCRLRPQTGRTHQLRVQTAHRGVPILGDTLYSGGAGTGRVLLHAFELTFEHPTLGEVCFTAPPPPLLDPEELTLSPLVEAICGHIAFGEGDEARRLGTPSDTGLPELKLDQYGRHLVIRRYVDDSEASAWDDGALRTLATHLATRGGLTSVVEKRHPQKGSATSLWHGDALPGAGEVVEGPLRFQVDLNADLGAGLYLDQRDNRAWVRKVASGAEVLNLFAYTCSFSVAAAKGGAKRTTNVDVSRKSLATGRHNFELNGLDPAQHRFFSDDTTKALARADRRGDRYDLIVCDPPPFARMGKKKFSVVRDLPELLQGCFRVLADGGRLLLCVNHRGLRVGQIDEMVRDAIAGTRRQAAELRIEITEDGYRPLGVGTDLKSCYVRLR